MLLGNESGREAFPLNGLFSTVEDDANGIRFHASSASGSALIVIAAGFALSSSSFMKLFR